MKVVVVGSGGREHALASVLGRTAEVIVTPGNPGIPGSVDTPVTDLVADGSVDLVVIGPEQPLVAGLADRLRAKGVRVFGPGAEGARVEGSKAYMKQLAEAAGLHCSRLSGAPIVYNNPQPYMPDFVICRREIADDLLEALRSPW
mgnify:CR=1 FL=1